MKRTDSFTLALIMFVAAFLAGCSQQDHAAMTENAIKNEQIEGAVRAVLDAQVAAWNQGDVEGFMDGYARSNETVFVSGDTVTRGWQTVLDRYKKTYDSREKMGTLAFTDLEIKSLTEETAIALGRWQLTRASDSPHGRFSLIFHRTPDGWRITHDHTSSAAE